MATPSLPLIDQLRRLIAEPTQDTYTDGLLSTMLARYPLPDVDGYVSTDAAWAGVWDVNQAAADCWEEKAAMVASDYDFTADGGSYQRSQAYANMISIARSFRARRKTSVLVLQAQPRPDNAPGLMDWLGNAPEVD